MSGRVFAGAALACGLVVAGGWMLRPRQEARAAAPASATDAAVHAFWREYQAASRARSAGDLDAAVAGYERALALRPNHEDSLYYLGNCYFERADYRQALTTYERLIAINPEGSSRAYVQAGLVHASLETGAPTDLAAAERAFARALAVDPESGALLPLAEVAILREDWPHAADYLQRLEADNPMSLASPYLLGFLAFRAGDRTGAARWLATAVSRTVVAPAPVKWTQEGDVKADPALRWRALTRQSVFGRYWIRARDYRPQPGPTAADVASEYGRFANALHDFHTRHH